MCGRGHPGAPTTVAEGAGSSCLWSLSHAEPAMRVLPCLGPLDLSPPKLRSPRRLSLKSSRSWCLGYCPAYCLSCPITSRAPEFIHLQRPKCRAGERRDGGPVVRPALSTLRRLEALFSTFTRPTPPAGYLAYGSDLTGGTLSPILPTPWLKLG